jgi:hypothetical protein
MVFARFSVECIAKQLKSWYKTRLFDCVYSALPIWHGLGRLVSSLWEIKAGLYRGGVFLPGIQAEYLFGVARGYGA